MKTHTWQRLMWHAVVETGLLPRTPMIVVPNGELGGELEDFETFLDFYCDAHDMEWTFTNHGDESGTYEVTRETDEGPVVDCRVRAACPSLCVRCDRGPDTMVMPTEPLCDYCYEVLKSKLQLEGGKG